MSATFRSKKNKAPIQERISELQRKITLLEGARRAQFESSQCLIKENREKILQLRHDNKLLHRKMAEALAGDEQVIKEVFQFRMLDKVAFRNMPMKDVVQCLDQKVSDKMKKLNTLKHVTNMQRQRLEELNTEYNTLRSQPDLQTAREVTNLRLLETRVEEAQLKCHEAERIVKSNRKLKEHLQEESLLFHPHLDEMECEVIRQKQELRDLQLMNNNAHQAKGASKAELQSLVYCERRMRKIILNQYENLAKEQKTQTDMKERQAQRVALHTDEKCEKDKTISIFEEAFKRITEATKITNANEVVNRFLSQCDTHTHLEQMKLQNECELQSLKEERDTIHTQYQDMKFLGETKLNHGRRMLEVCVSVTDRTEETRCS
ncbi:outer dynein arm-docking complex subunit 3-like [Silurus meridionalis]|uniref:outer dynein arm-docking complex subunit 3-like n=1 Tax=Silurus meridionalis TaxID=175797 RepID=UPI001EECBDE4|nr:outer dynein arm-docking complex subunit 3-like [Silurus meridionalis]